MELLFIDQSITREAARLRAKYNIRTPDAIQIVASIGEDCKYFLTNEKKLE